MVERFDPSSCAGVPSKQPFSESEGARERDDDDPENSSGARFRFRYDLSFFQALMNIRDVTCRRGGRQDLRGAEGPDDSDPQAAVLCRRRPHLMTMVAVFCCVCCRKLRSNRYSP